MKRKPIYFFDGIDLAKTYLEWKSPILSANFDLIQNYEALNIITKKLTEKEQTLGFFSSEMKTKWVILKQKQHDFLAIVRNYNSFFVENEKKMKRIKKKVGFEIELQKKFELEILKFEKRIEYLSNIEKKLEKSFKILHPYDAVAQNIAMKMKKFENVKDLVNHYTLLNTETRLMNEFIENLDDSESLQTRILKNSKIRKQTFSDQSNSLYYLSKIFRDLRDDSEKWENKLYNQIETNKCQAREMNIIKCSCENVYTKLRKWKKIPSSRHEKNEEKLAFIINTIQDLESAVDLSHELILKNEISFLTDSSYLTPRRII